MDHDSQRRGDPSVSPPLARPRTARLSRRSERGFTARVRSRCTLHDRKAINHGIRAFQQFRRSCARRAAVIVSQTVNNRAADVLERSFGLSAADEAAPRLRPHSPVTHLALEPLICNRLASIPTDTAINQLPTVLITSVRRNQSSNACDTFPGRRRRAAGRSISVRTHSTTPRSGSGRASTPHTQIHNLWLLFECDSAETESGDGAEKERNVMQYAIQGEGNKVKREQKQ